ncbi:MAG TPA: class I SAM-dependent methyltransferase, partial [Thermoanaerobaculia bacterium]|nr:class I SAM-dependent methyltransferase [Thermoanaerobaculia bacterium]
MALKRLRSMVRRFFPRRTDPVLDTPPQDSPEDARLEALYARAVGDHADDFTRMRFQEGRRWRAVAWRIGAETDRVLDIGGGNGAVELAFAAGGSAVFSVEREWNDDVRRIHRAAGLPLRRVIADSAALPFRRDAFSLVLLLETIEHMEDTRTSAREIERVMREGAMLFITTPPRWRFLLGADPHFGIRGLLLLPMPLQRRIAARRGFTSADHHVET